MRRRIFSIWDLVSRAVVEFSNDKALKLSASLAYYTIFALPPMLIVIITTVGLVYGREAVQGQVFAQVKDLVGVNAALQIEDTIRNISMARETHLANIIGIITLIIGATGVFTEIQDSINIIWGIKAKPAKGWLRLLLNRLLSFSMVIAIGFILLVSLVVEALLAAFSNKIKLYFPDIALYFLQSINLFILLAITTLLFAIIFKVLPDARIRWRDVWIGSLVTSLLFMLGKFLIGFYLGQSTLSSAYGAAGSVVIVLLWVYYSSIILYFGAEFTQVYAYRFGARISPRPYAVWVEHKEIERRDAPHWQSSRKPPHKPDANDNG
jgi:membrane protein